MIGNQSSVGRLVVLEGPDGVGKTTLAARLVEELNQRNVDARGLSFPGRLEGTLGDLVYRVHHEPVDFGIAETIDPAAVQLLHIAAHVDVIESTIRPSLESGQSIVLDRYWWSTWVYGRAAGVSVGSLDRMIDVEAAHWGNRSPDPVFLVSRPKSQNTSELTDLYEELAIREANRVSVIRVRNDDTPGTAVSTMVHTLMNE